MIKVLGFIPRRTDLSREAFREYYETRHVVLALRHIRRFEKYVRNHLVASVPDNPGFDCLPEWWFEDEQAPDEIGAWVASPEGKVIRDDESNFMHQARMRHCAVDEKVLHGPARGVEEGVVRKLGLMLTRGESTDRDEFAAELERFCDDLHRRNQERVTRIGIDTPLAQEGGPAPPMDALIWVWPRSPDTALAVPEVRAALGSLTQLTCDAFETPTSELKD